MEARSFSIRLAAGISLLSCTLSLHATTDAVPWHQSEAEIRFTVEPTFPPENGTDCMGALRVSLSPVGIEAWPMSPSVYTRSGKRAECRALYSHPGDPVTILIYTNDYRRGTDNEGRLSDSPFFLYLARGTNSVLPSPSTGFPGLLLESRTVDGAVREISVSDFNSLWQSADYTNGSMLVDSVNQGHPVLPMIERVPHEYAQYRHRGLSLNRYTGKFSFMRDLEMLQDSRKQLESARETRTRILEQAEKAHFKLREAEYELAISAVYPGVLKVSKELLSKRLHTRLKAYERLARTEKKRIDEVILTASNRIAEITSGKHTFHAGSRAGSHLLIDGEEILNWPADKALNLYRGRYINLDSVDILLKEGVHTFEYLHYANVSNYMATVAWKRPGADAAETMNAADFGPVTDAAVTSVSLRDSPESPLMFSWHIVDDLRCPAAGDIVNVAFAVSTPLPDARYEWAFGDGMTARGAECSHLYFLTGRYSVSLTEHDTSRGTPERTAEHTINVHVLWDKRALANLSRYDDVVADTDLAGADIRGLLNAYDFAHKSATAGAPLHAWREHTRAALVRRLDEFPEESLFQLVTIGDDSIDPRIGRYDQALEAYSNALHRLPADSDAHIDAVLGFSRALVEFYGESEPAVTMLAALEKDERLAGGRRVRMRLLTADALLAAGRKAEAEELLKSRASIDPEAAALQEIQQRAGLRHARTVAANGEASIDELVGAMNEIDLLIEQDPPLALSPEANLVKLDIMLALGEFRRATHMLERILKLAIPETYRPAILAGKVRALHGAGDLEGARETFREFTRKYPYNSELPNDIAAELTP